MPTPGTLCTLLRHYAHPSGTLRALGHGAAISRIGPGSGVFILADPERRWLKARGKVRMGGGEGFAGRLNLRARTASGSTHSIGGIRRVSKGCAHGVQRVRRASNERVQHSRGEHCLQGLTRAVMVTVFRLKVPEGVFLTRGQLLSGPASRQELCFLLKDIMHQW